MDKDSLDALLDEIGCRDDDSSVHYKVINKAAAQQLIFLMGAALTMELERHFKGKDGAHVERIVREAVHGTLTELASAGGTEIRGAMLFIGAPDEADAGKAALTN